MKFYPLVDEEITSSGGMTHKLEMSYADIPTGLANAAANIIWPITLPLFDISTIIRRVEVGVPEYFQAAADPTAFNSDTISVGDTGSATRFVSAAEVNVNAAGKVPTVFPGATENYIYTAALRLVFTMNSMTGKSLSNLTKGRVYVLFGIDRPLAATRTKQAPFGPGTTTTN